jgi:putative NADH-flavin reductase
MRVLVLGASGRTGRLIAEHLVAQGHEVASLGRTDPRVAGVAHAAGAPGESAAMAAVVRGCDAVVSALASTNAAPVCSAATAALLGSGALPRYVVVGGAAVDAPGDAKRLPDRIVGGIMRLFVGRMLADRQREWQMLEASRIPYVFLRPPRLTDAAPAGRWSFTFDRPARMDITRADLAAAAVEALARPDLTRRAPFVAGGAA